MTLIMSFLHKLVSSHIIGYRFFQRILKLEKSEKISENFLDLYDEWYMLAAGMLVSLACYGVKMLSEGMKLPWVATLLGIPFGYQAFQLSYMASNPMNCRLFLMRPNPLWPIHMCLNVIWMPIGLTLSMVHWFIALRHVEAEPRYAMIQVINKIV
eukprot:UN24829